MMLVILDMKYKMFLFVAQHVCADRRQTTGKAEPYAL